MFSNSAAGTGRRLPRCWNGVATLPASTSRYPQQSCAGRRFPPGRQAKWQLPMPAICRLQREHSMPWWRSMLSAIFRRKTGRLPLKRSPACCGPEVPCSSRDSPVRIFGQERARKSEPWTFARRNGIATHYFTEDEVRSLVGSRFDGECTTHTWDLTVRGERFPRAEITGRFGRLL